VSLVGPVGYRTSIIAVSQSVQLMAVRKTFGNPLTSKGFGTQLEISSSLRVHSVEIQQLVLNTARKPQKQAPSVSRTEIVIVFIFSQRIPSSSIFNFGDVSYFLC